MIPDSISTKNHLQLDPVQVDLKISVSVETVALIVFALIVLLSWGVIKVKKG